MAGGHEVRSAYRLAAGTGLYPRDVSMKASTGGLFKIPDPDLGLLEFSRKGLYEVAFQGGINVLQANQAVPAATLTPINYGLPNLDTVAMWDQGPPVGWRIPAGVNVVQLHAGHQAFGSGVNRNWSFISKNNLAVVWANESDAANTKYVNVTTGPIQVVQGDLFEHLVQSQGADTFQAQFTMFQVEILDANFPPAT